MPKHLTIYLFALFQKKHSCTVKSMPQAIWLCQLMLEYAKRKRCIRYGISSISIEQSSIWNSFISSIMLISVFWPQWEYFIQKTFDSGIVIQLGDSYQPHHTTPENLSPSSLFTHSPTFQALPQSGLCGLGLSVISLVLLIWASCWERGPLIHCTKRWLIELVRPEPVGVLIRSYLTSSVAPGDSLRDTFLIGLLASKAAIM